MHKPRIVAGPIAELKGRKGRKLKIGWIPALVQEIKINKSALRNKMLQALAA